MKVDKILKANSNGDRIATAQTEPLLSVVKDKLPTIAEESDSISLSSKPRSAHASGVVSSVQMKIIAKLERVSVEIVNDKRPIVNLSIQNLLSSIIIKSSYTEVSLTLRDINVHDKNPQSIHTTVSIRKGFNFIYLFNNKIYAFIVDFISYGWKCHSTSTCFIQSG